MLGLVSPVRRCQPDQVVPPSEVYECSQDLTDELLMLVVSSAVQSSLTAPPLSEAVSPAGVEGTPVARVSVIVTVLDCTSEPVKIGWGEAPSWRVKEASLLPPVPNVAAGWNSSTLSLRLDV